MVALATNRRRRAHVPASQVAEIFAPQRTGNSELPDPVPLITALTRGVIEARAGTRPVEQLARWLAEEPYLALAQHAALVTRARAAQRRPVERPQYAIRSMRHMSPVDGVVEAVAIVATPERTRAVALRLEGMDRRWRVTSLSII